MSPTLQDGQVVLVNRLTYLFSKPKLGDIVACRDPRDGRVLIKRITNIIRGQYFVLGDNKKGSTDSRKFGMIEKTALLGKVSMSFL
jgi:signal peptidase I